MIERKSNFITIFIDQNSLIKYSNLDVILNSIHRILLKYKNKKSFKK